jgi:hypothetical protein
MKLDRNSITQRLRKIFKLNNIIFNLKVHIDEYLHNIHSNACYWNYHLTYL